MRLQTTVLAIVLAAACGSHKEDVYPPEVVQNFMRSCRAGSEQRTCRCALDALQSHFTVEEFRALETRVSKGEVPKEMVDVTAACR